jgi:prevent-host-death family protein
MLRQPATQTLSVSAARGQLGRLVTRVFNREARIVIEKSGIPVAVLVSTADVERLERLERERSVDFEIIDEIQRRFEGVPDEDLEQEVARAVREAREAYRVGLQDEG